MEGRQVRKRKFLFLCDVYFQVPFSSTFHFNVSYLLLNPECSYSISWFYILLLYIFTALAIRSNLFQFAREDVFSHQ
jgi:hypothetical protein